MTKLLKNKTVFIAGYTTLSDDEKKEADKLIKQLKKDGNKIIMGV